MLELALDNNLVYIGSNPVQLNFETITVSCNWRLRESLLGIRLSSGLHFAQLEDYTGRRIVHRLRSASDTSVTPVIPCNDAETLWTANLQFMKTSISFQANGVGLDTVETLQALYVRSKNFFTTLHNTEELLNDAQVTWDKKLELDSTYENLLDTDIYGFSLTGLDNSINMKSLFTEGGLSISPWRCAPYADVQGTLFSQTRLSFGV